MKYARPFLSHVVYRPCFFQFFPFHQRPFTLYSVSPVSPPVPDRGFSMAFPPSPLHGALSSPSGSHLHPAVCLCAPIVFLSTIFPFPSQRPRVSLFSFQSLPLRSFSLSSALFLTTLCGFRASCSDQGFLSTVPSSGPSSGFPLDQRQPSRSSNFSPATTRAAIDEPLLNERMNISAVRERFTFGHLFHAAFPPAFVRNFHDFENIESRLARPAAGTFHSSAIGTLGDPRLSTTLRRSSRSRWVASHRVPK